MEKNIWVHNNNKNELIQVQQKINGIGGMRTYCMLSFEAVERAVSKGDMQNDPQKILLSRPLIIILDYETETTEEFKTYRLLSSHSAYAGIPIVFTVNERNNEKDEQCYELGAGLIAEKPLSISAIRRIERMAWQYEKATSYEKVLQKQANEIALAKKIKALNEQLESRNALLHKIFGRYFSEEVVNVILERPGGDDIGGEKREITVLLADLRGFTATAEKLPADVVTDMINNFLGKMTEIIFAFHGTVIEFIGDAILAIFGAPIDYGNHARDAVEAGIMMQNGICEVNQYNETKGYPDIEMGIGIHSGEAFVGNIGSEHMMRYNVIGNTVNQCSRIESCSVGGQVLVSSDTISRITEKIQIKSSFSIAAKGLSSVINVCEVTGIENKEEIELGSEMDETMYEASKEVTFRIRMVHEKTVSDEIISAYVRKVSHRRAWIELCSDKEIPFLANVEVDAFILNEIPLFSNFYAKVIEKRDNMYLLHFTTSQKDYELYYDKIKKTITSKLEDKMYRKIGNYVTGGNRVYESEEHPIVVVVVAEGHSPSMQWYENILNERKTEVLVSVVSNSDIIQLNVMSSSQKNRALEMLDYMLGDYGVMEGNESYATGKISKVLLEVNLVESGTGDGTRYFMERAESYFEEVSVVYAGNEDMDVSEMKKYNKKNVAWAYVKTTDIGVKGDILRIKSLENTTGAEVTVDEDVYAMIGNCGEVYDIKKDKFESSYDESDEELNIFEQMLEFIPTVEKVSDGSYIALDEIAHLCYPKKGNGIYAKKLIKRTKVYRGNDTDEYFVGRPGDFLAVRCDDLKDVYIIQGDIFSNTYE